MTTTTRATTRATTSSTTCTTNMHGRQKKRLSWQNRRSMLRFVPLIAIGILVRNCIDINIDMFNTIYCEATTTTRGSEKMHRIHSAHVNTIESYHLTSRFMSNAIDSTLTETKESDNDTGDDTVESEANDSDEDENSDEEGQTEVKGSDLSKETECSKIEECRYCTKNDRLEVDECEQTNRIQRFECVTRTYHEDDDQKQETKFKSCQRTASDDTFLMIRLQLFCVLLGSLSLFSVRRQKRRNTSLFDQRKQKESQRNAQPKNDGMVTEMVSLDISEHSFHQRTRSRSRKTRDESDEHISLLSGTSPTCTQNNDLV